MQYHTGSKCSGNDFNEGGKCYEDQDEGEYDEAEFDDQIENLRLLELLCIFSKSILSIPLKKIPNALSNLS